MKKSYLAIMLVVALLIGAGGTYVTMQWLGSAEINQTGDGITNFADLSEQDQEAIINDASNSTTLSKVMQAYSLIQDNYLENVDKDTLIEGAVQGMLKTLDDPYSVYMDAETVKEFNQQIESSFEGIGAEVSMVDGKVTIVAPIKDSPAERAGLKPNDQILKVNGDSVEGLDLYEAVSKIRGKQGTTVTLEIDRPGVTEPLTVDLVRDDIPLETVYSEVKEVEGKKQGIIEITSFSEKTADRFEEELTYLEDQGIQGLVIDVRGNPGGLLTAIEDILKHFVTKDQPYLQIENGDGKKERHVSSLEEGKEYPISVLINEGSASASEILAVSLKEAANAEVVGVTSYGKGTVQQTIPMGDGSTIKLTLYKWLSPKGNWIHEKGVEPTIKVEQPEYFYANPIQVEETFTYNDSDDNIANAQVILKGLGYDPGREDGYFSEKTKVAIKNYQKDNKLKVSGELTNETAEKLQTSIIEKIRSGEDDLQKDAALQSLVD
ncbi:Carboxy-terminal processing protease CtpB precursor [Paraliobacillus sp. PM-2]|uniref:S41 family peptidase n=1 Tax=Paraliobacillus sp. PM-2 TaxID=1462524 RepID=UPI00061C6C39|nr:S41 family peptidase [Paraliobacillus sp. PM-2]CQR46454.1 Carboxy-terminal processing protease CtpB precursor [Paraliobacillus sp. PM-2]